MHTDCDAERFVGESPTIQTVRAEIQAASQSDAKVLITGETGVGKDVVARLIHRESVRRAAPFVAINCAGVPDSLLESELFGHVRGSFTGAVRDTPGLLASAGRGTLFLDEVGEMSLRMQAVLLRFLETGELQRVGSTSLRSAVNVRTIAATNRDLLPEIAAGAFRQDLYYRINILRIAVPPLRERGDDILLLMEHFLMHYGRHHGVSSSRLSQDAQAALLACRWPGNVRQLKNVAERLVLHRRGRLIEEGDLPRELWEPRAAPSSSGAQSTGTESQIVERQLLSRMLHGGESFWSAVHAPFMNHDLSRAHLEAVVTHGLQKTAGNYRLVVELFNMAPGDYKRFLAFLYKHGCKPPYQAFRVSAAGENGSRKPDSFTPASLAP